MKTIIIALAIIGITCSGAEAQTKGPVSKTNDKCLTTAKKVKAKKIVRVKRLSPATTPLITQRGKTYQVCREEGGYYTCCLYNNTATTRSW